MKREKSNRETLKTLNAKSFSLRELFLGFVVVALCTLLYLNLPRDYQDETKASLFHPSYFADRINEIDPNLRATYSWNGFCGFIRVSSLSQMRSENHSIISLWVTEAIDEIEKSGLSVNATLSQGNGTNERIARIDWQSKHMSAKLVLTRLDTNFSENETGEIEITENFFVFVDESKK